mgnify:FL=1
MFVKQIDEKTALELAAKGKEVLVMIPGGKDSGWEDMMPDSLGHMLEGCLFFRKEPAMEVDLVGEEPQQEAAGEDDQSPDPPPSWKTEKD